jgi:hypothetical protein
LRQYRLGECHSRWCSGLGTAIPGVTAIHDAALYAGGLEMTEQTTIQMSQGLEILRPRSDQAYPIPCEEWILLKTKISRMTAEPWFFHTVGSVLIGAAASTWIAILVGTFSAPAQHDALVIAWAVVATTTLAGVLCLFFAHEQRKADRERASDVVAQMVLIEKRYERALS